MTLKLGLFGLLTASSFAFAAGGKIDWTPCKKEIQEYCTSAADDKEKHECLEEAPKNGISKTCKDHNEKVEAQIGHKHEKGHSH